MWIFIMVYALPENGSAFTGLVEYKEFTTTGESSTAGVPIQGDFLVCCYTTASAPAFSGTVKVQIYHTLGSGKSEWIDTGDTFTEEGCKILTVPENGVKVRAYATVSSGSIRCRISQEYPPKTYNIGK